MLSARLWGLSECRGSVSKERTELATRIIGVLGRGKRGSSCAGVSERGREVGVEKGSNLECCPHEVIKVMTAGGSLDRVVRTHPPKCKLAKWHLEACIDDTARAATAAKGALKAPGV